MTDIATEQPRAHARIVYLGPVSPHWEVYGDYGDRTLLDVLNAENAQADAELALAQARCDQVLTRLRLAALADRLDEALLAQVNALLAPEAGPEAAR